MRHLQDDSRTISTLTLIAALLAKKLGASAHDLMCRSRVALASKERSIKGNIHCWLQEVKPEEGTVQRRSSKVTDINSRLICSLRKTLICQK